MTLNVSDTLSLPLDYATDTGAALGIRGSGKSNTLVVIAEELAVAGVPWVAIDPKGDWWGVRSSGDGTSPGLSVPVFGGRHGDLPLDPGAGPFLADLILDRLLSCVLDVSRFSKADRVRFLTAFGRRLYDQAVDEPIHLLLEEAHDYIPQQPDDGEKRCIAVYADIVRWGRTKGLGCTLASQRAAVVNKNVLNQCQVLFAHRVIARLDRDAIKGWVEFHGQVGEILSTLHALGPGEAWVSAPTMLEEPRRVQFRQRSTFDSGATPKVGEKRREPSTLADVDLAAIKESMAETIERAKADDPKELRRRITELERELRDVQHAMPEPVVERAEVPVLDAATVAQLGEVVGRLAEAAADVGRISDVVTDALEAAERSERDRQDVPGARPAGRGARPVAPRAPERAPQRTDPAAGREPGRAAVPGAAEGAIPPGPRSLLRVLAARYPAWLTRRQVVTLAKRGPKSSALNDHFGWLLVASLAVFEHGAYQATPAGVEAMGGQFADDPIEAWHGAFSGATQKVFDALVRVYPERYTKDGIADMAGLSRTSSSVGQALTDLRRNGLAEDYDDGIQAADILFEGRS